MQRSWFRVVATAACLVIAACDRRRTPFDGNAALGYVKTLTDLGPRAPGSPAHEKAADWIVAEMKRRADTVVVQSWTHTTVKGEHLPMRNVLARFRPNDTERVLYMTHWDTRPTSDADPNIGARQLPILGANDGASGPALFLALGDVLRKTPPNVGVDLLFVDGEDWGDFKTYSDTASTPDVLIGSTYFATHLPSADYKPLYGVLWDMIGDRDLQVYQEINSVQGAPEVVQRVWAAAANLGYSKVFIGQPKYQLTDDHVPFLKRGLRAIDVVDFDYCDAGVDCEEGTRRNFHHTQQDTFDKVSARSLQIVGDVATSLVSR